MGELIVVVPCYQGVIDVECERGLRSLEGAGAKVWREPGFSAIDRARNVLAARALKAGAEAILWIDADTVFRPEDALAFHRSGEALLAGIYPKKGKRSIAAELLPGTREIHFGALGGLLEVRYIGAGFLYTRAEVYRRMERELPLCESSEPEPFHPYFLPAVVEAPDGKLRYLGEDFAFCERARKVGFRILADTRVRLGHAGRYVYGWEDAGGALARFDDYRFEVTG